MNQKSRAFAVTAALLAASFAAGPSVAQKQGGILKIYMLDSPASMSIHEEATVVAERPVMGVFNNLVMFDQHVQQNSLGSIVPDLAIGWSWNEDGTDLTFPLREGVKWHDGRPFTAKDVKCTWDLLTGKSSEKFRINPRKSWYRNLEEVTTNGDYEVTFRLKRPQPAFLALLASGFSPIYPCHVAPRDMRGHPIGTGPFKFGDFKPNEYIKIMRNPDYWKKGRPYLDGIEYTVTRNRSTAILAFIAGNYDLTFAGSVTVPLMKEVKSQMPEAICELPPGSVSNNLIVNRDAPPFDNPDLRRAMALSLDRQAFVDILSEGKGNVGGAMRSADARWAFSASRSARTVGNSTVPQSTLTTFALSSPGVNPSWRTSDPPHSIVFWLTAKELRQGWPWSRQYQPISPRACLSDRAARLLG
jgi:peptide/nickel transport system substrate-binding protein